MPHLHQKKKGGFRIEYLKSKILTLVKESGTKNPLIYVRDAIRKYSEDMLNNAIMNCDICNFDTHKTLGSGNIRGTVLIIGDYPYSPTDKQYIKPLKDATPENQFIHTIASTLNLDPNEFYYINAVNCYCVYDINGIKQARPPGSKEIKNCSVYVKHVVELMHPALIILLGNIALNVFKKESMTKAHGQWINAYTIPAMPVYSPSYIQSLAGKVTEERRQQLVTEMWTDIKHAFMYLQTNYPNAKIFVNNESEE